MQENNYSNKCWYELDIDMTEAFQDSWSVNIGKLNFRPTYNTEIYKPEFMQKLISLGAIIDPTELSLVFHRDPYVTDIKAHIDTRRPEYYGTPLNFKKRYTVAALNWVTGGEGAKMVWYETPENYEGAIDDADPQLPAAYAPYTSWLTYKLKRLDEHAFRPKLTLVRVDVPHAITYGTTHRYCVSTKLDNSLDDLSWEQIVEHFHKHKLITQ